MGNEVPFCSYYVRSVNNVINIPFGHKLQCLKGKIIPAC